MSVRLAGFTSREVLRWSLRSSDPLHFPGYDAYLLGDTEPCTVEVGMIAGRKVLAVDLDFTHMGGTMGTVVGECLVRAFDFATSQKLPIVASVSSGGARLQEGMLSLIQMTRTAAAVVRHRDASLLSIAILRSPTTGGVYASWSSLLSLRAAEAKAVLGFGGPRVVEQVTGQLPRAQSHSSEAAFDSGLIDALVTPETEAVWLGNALGTTAAPIALRRRRSFSTDAATGAELYGWDLVQHARRHDRPSGPEWAAALTTSWLELAGADPVVRSGLATFAGRRIVVIALDRHAYNNSSARPGPQGYRQAQRAIRLAGALGLPILTLIDTPGAEPGPEAERGGIASEIASTLLELGNAPVPTVGICVGEGGSGGAMAFGNADRLYLLEDAFFSVIGPEAAAVVLEHDAARAPWFAASMCISSQELVRFGTVDAALPWRYAEDVQRMIGAIATAFETSDRSDRQSRPDRATAIALETEVESFPTTRSA